MVFQIQRYDGGAQKAIQYRYLNSLADRETFYGYLELERTTGCDAIIPVCFFDPLLREARQALEVPFIGPGETAMRLAAMMGRKFGVVSQGTRANWTIEDNIRHYGLESHALPVRGLPVSYDEQQTGLLNAAEDIAGFLKVSRELIADGAEVLIPGCMLLDTALRLAPGCEKEYPNGVLEVDGVPVMNVMAFTIKVAEAFAAMKKAGLPWISRRLYYRSARGDRRGAGGGRQPAELSRTGCLWVD